MTEAPHVLVQAEVECGGRLFTGVSAETWVPKWFTKNPDTTYAQDLPDLCRTVEHAAEAAVSPREALTLFAWWRALYAAQSELSVPPLLAHLGTAMIERAVTHAVCQAHRCSLHQLWCGDGAGIDMGSMRPELNGLTPSAALPPVQARALTVRHTVGLADPLTDAEIDEPLHDGLPHSLEENIRAYGLTHFKIKLAGEATRDTERLLRLAEVLPPHAQFTLDANENYPDIRVFRAHWDAWMARPALAAWLERGLLLVEQPLHRDASFHPDTAAAFAAWTQRPPVIIDEADATLADLPRALALGYAGTSHKNCKGLLKGLANAMLLHRTGGILSGEDLSNTGPVALLQDLAAMTALGVPHVERNGHHYFRGLAQWPAETAESLAIAHPALYRRRVDLIALHISRGKIDVTSAARAPLGLTSTEVIAGFTDGLPAHTAS